MIKTSKMRIEMFIYFEPLIDGRGWHWVVGWICCSCIYFTFDVCVELNYRLQSMLLIRCKFVIWYARIVFISYECSKLCFVLRVVMEFVLFAYFVCYGLLSFEIDNNNFISRIRITHRYIAQELVLYDCYGAPM